MSNKSDFIAENTEDNFTALKEAELKLHRHEKHLDALNLIGEVLLSVDYGTLNSLLNKIVEIIGQTFGNAKISIYKINCTEESMNCLNLCSWCKGKALDIEMDAENYIPLPNSWVKSLINGNFLCRILSEVKGTETKYFKSNDIQSIMIFPVVIKNVTWGCLELLYNDRERIFDESGINALSSIANLLAYGVMKNESTELLMNSFNTNKTILDSNPFNSIMFDMDCNILDCNMHARNFFGFTKLTDAKKIFENALKVMVPEYQPHGKKSIPFSERLKTTFENNYHTFETRFIVLGKSMYFNIIMNKVIYKGKEAVVTYMIDLTAQKEAQLDLEYRGNLLEALGSVTNILLTTDTNDLNSTMHKALDKIGRAVSVDRVYVWKNHQGEDGRLYTSQIFEWSPDAAPQQGNELAVNISYEDAVPSWENNLKKGLCLNSFVRNTLPAEQAQLVPQGILSILLVPIFLQDKFWGFIGFDDCQNERVFSAVEENILRICGFMTMVISDTIQNEMTMQLLAEKEAALINAQLKTNFLANMSHEIRTPMNAILGMVELIMHEKETTDTILSYALDIRSACRVLLAIINDILDISKIESGKLEIVPICYHISSLLMDVISIIKTRADKKNISFVVNIDANIPSELFGDELRIKQILINLLNNAVNFTHEGQVTLTVSSTIENDTCHMTFSVADTGIGIKTEDMEKIFVLFQQVDTKKNRNIEGTGLGLSISKQLVEMMGGSIEMESEYGVGSLFIVSINQPIENAQPVTALKNPKQNSVLIYENRSVYLNSLTFALDSLGCNYKICSNRIEMNQNLNDSSYSYIFISSLYIDKIQATAALKQPNAVIIILNGDGNPYYKGNMLSVSMPIHCLQLANILNEDYDNYYNRQNDLYIANITAPKAKVLVVDDNIINLKVAVGLLHIFKIKADTASNGIRAVEMVSKTDYDLVFMDHMMPDMDGIDTTIAIRNLGEKYKQLPIIALTANAIGGVKEMFKAEGLNDFLAKPIEMSLLNAMLKKWIPRNKQIKETGVNVPEEISFKILGLNTDKGIRNSGGVVDTYNKILSIYITDCGNRLDEMAKHHKEGNIKALTTCIHAIKGASANIGADEISHMAAEMENAGMIDDIHYIDANMCGFSDSLSFLLDNIRNYLNSLNINVAIRDKAADFSLLKAVLTEIKLNMEKPDIDLAESALEELYTYQWDEDIFQWLNKIKNCVETFDYENTQSVIDQLITIIDVL